MEFTGIFKGVTTDWATGQHNITFSINEKSALEQIKSIQDCEKLSIEAKQYRKKRSLDANAYFHLLVGKLADVLRISKPRCKNILLHRYGQPILLDNDEQAIVKSNVPSSQILEREDVHLFPCGSKIENGTEITFYKWFRGSSTYDTREMSILIDGTVDECKGMGIETATPDEIERMKQLWKSGR